MSIVGVVDVLRGKPRNPIGPDGRMALSDHFRELRARLIRSALILVIAFFVAIFFYDQLLDLVNRPYLDAQRALRDNGTVSIHCTAGLFATNGQSTANRIRSMPSSMTQHSSAGLEKKPLEVT